MGGHFCVRELEAISPLPILNAIPEVDAAIKRRNLKTAGILGNMTVMESRLYGGISGAKIVLPEVDSRQLVHESYREMALSGRVTGAQRQVFFASGLRMCQDLGAEAVILGGTDLFLAFQDQAP